MISFVAFMRVPAISTFEGDNLAMACLESSLPSMSFDRIEEKAEKDVPAKENKSQDREDTNKTKTEKKAKREKGKPLVLIYHTHSTESYLPASAGNYHSVNEKNTVRQVGDVLAKSLEEEGIEVVHDKTIHDNPSYDSAYERSYDTAERLLKKYPSVVCVIDLHRDAISSSQKGDTFQVKGKKCATYSYVIGTAASTFESNESFVETLNSVAESQYDGFTGEVMYRDYIYNQDLCSKSILLEMGNNRNMIEEAENSAKMLGKIIADSV